MQPEINDKQIQKKIFRNNQQIKLLQTFKLELKQWNKFKNYKNEMGEMTQMFEMMTSENERW